MVKKIAAFLSLFIACLQVSWGQDDNLMSLENCIQYAWKYNLQLKQSTLSIEQAKQTKRQAWWDRFPSVNANVGLGLNFGRSVDFTSYQFVNNLVFSNNYGLGLNQNIYSGLIKKNTLQQADLDRLATKEDYRFVKNNIALGVAQLYLSVLLAQENILVIKAQNKLNKEQFEQTVKLIKAGVVAENNRFDLEAQLALDEQTLMDAENALNRAMLNLKTQMNYDIAQEMKLEQIDVTNFTMNTKASDLETIYKEAIQTQANIQAASLREQSAELALSIAKGSLQPSVSLGFNLGTRYSSAGQEADLDNIQLRENSTLIEWNGIQDYLTIYSPEPSFKNTPYFRQLGNNISGQLSLNINIPIFNGFKSRIGIERAKLGAQLARTNKKQLEQQLKTDVQGALLDVNVALKRLSVAERSLKFTRLSVDNTRKRYRSGIVNAFELLSVQNALLRAESNLLQAKYDYLFKLKVLEFYRGNTIQ